MAKYDFGGGCDCGLYSECQPDCLSHPKNINKINKKRIQDERKLMSDKLETIADLLENLTHVEMMRLSRLICTQQISLLNYPVEVAEKLLNVAKAIKECP